MTKPKTASKPKSSKASNHISVTSYKAPAPKKKTKPATHPPWADMIVAVVTELGTKRKGHSIQAIKKKLFEDYGVANGKTDKANKYYLKQGMTAALDADKLVQVKGTGLSGSFKLPPKKYYPKKPKQQEDDVEEVETDQDE